MGGTVNVNTSGGIAPYTYAWVRNSGTASNISNAASSSPTISATLNTAGQSLTESWTVTVKDSTNTSTSASVTANFTVNSTPLTASVSPATVNLNTTEAGTVSSTVTATPSGGVAPYRYQWNRTTGTRSIISSNTVSAPSISAALVANDNFSETWNVVITDANNVTSSANVIVNFKVTAPGVAVVRYIHTDGLGSPVAKSDASGNLIAGSRTRYEPYGMSVAGTAVPTIGFTGHVNDADTGLTYMQQRYYDPVAARFLSEDPVLTDANTGKSFNRYVYAENNPLKYIDPDGRSPIDVVFLAWDLGKLGAALYTGVGVGQAAADVAMSIAGVVSPVPGTGQMMKASSTIYTGSKLARNMNKAGNPVEKGVKEAHHIAAQADKRAVGSRQILERNKIDINSAENGAAMGKSEHKTVHTNKYHQDVENRLEVAEKRGTCVFSCQREVKGELQKIRKELEN